MTAILTVATPEVFGEAKRMKAQMGPHYMKNDPQVIAHQNTVQDIRKNSKAENGKNMGKIPNCEAACQV